MSKIITAEFKCETAKLVLDQNYTYQEAAKGMNVSLSAISRWVRALRLERQGKTSPGLPLTPEQIESAVELSIARRLNFDYKVCYELYN